jgi:hypothetical protein
MRVTAKRLRDQLIWWGWLPALYAIAWAILHGLFEGYRLVQRFDQFSMAQIWSGGGYLWLALAVWFVGSAVIWSSRGSRSWSSQGRGTAERAIGVGLAVLAVLAAGQTWRVVWDNDKDFGRYYARSITFYAPDPTTAASLARLVDKATPSTSGCDLTGTADVPSCVKRGDLPAGGWEPRVGSLDGARIALSRTSGDVQRVSLNTDTLAYLSPWHGQTARWSGVLDGNGITQPLGGVAQWQGTGSPTQCTFAGGHRIDRAFAGSRSNSLPNLLAERYPDLRWDIHDVWGYCDGDEPVVVIPMTRQIYFKNRTVTTAGGVVTVRGDHGDTKLTYVQKATPDQFPGPVFPASLVARQREEASWSAGRENKNRNGFGYEPATSQAQANNVSEYLLRSKDTSRLQWVTPLTLRNSSSELFVAYAVSAADEVTADNLNPMSIYVLADNDARRVNIDNLEADARNYVSSRDPGFFSSKGVLIEFTPINGDVWRAFGELNGRVVYQLDISASAKVAPQLVSLDAQNQTTTPAQGNATCGKEVAQLTPTELADCAKRFVDELARRQNGPAK